MMCHPHKKESTTINMLSHSSIVCDVPNDPNHGDEAAGVEQVHSVSGRKRKRAVGKEESCSPGNNKATNRWKRIIEVVVFDAQDVVKENISVVSPAPEHHQQIPDHLIPEAGNGLEAEKRKPSESSKKPCASTGNEDEYDEKADQKKKKFKRELKKKTRKPRSKATRRLKDDNMLEWMISPVFLRDYHEGIYLREPINDLDKIFL
mmetsp:Transcript_37382/g.77539  ORF Transcript_37382/g.77539 Transcript_37382/m.77539 type:complete len:205 (-) Transcript_37382:687-1301(-)